MNRLIVVALLFWLGPNQGFSQQELIFESDSIRIYETKISDSVKDNLFPNFYKDGLIFTSGTLSKYYNPYFSDLKGELQKIKISQRFRLGGMAIRGNEIYFTGLSNKLYNYNYNLAIYKGTFKDFKVSKIKRLDICKAQFTYAHPALSPSGEKMVIITNEKGRYHLLELKKDENNEWVHNEVIFIAHPSYELINPTYFDENTIYFSSNYHDNPSIVDAVVVPKEDGKVEIVDIVRETKSFNLYKTSRRKNYWTIPKPISELNSEFDDLGVLFITKNTGYLTSFRFDNTDNIYYFEIINSKL